MVNAAAKLSELQQPKPCCTSAPPLHVTTALMQVGRALAGCFVLPPHDRGLEWAPTSVSPLQHLSPSAALCYYGVYADVRCIDDGGPYSVRCTQPTKQSICFVTADPKGTAQGTFSTLPSLGRDRLRQASDNSASPPLCLAHFRCVVCGLAREDTVVGGAPPPPPRMPEGGAHPASVLCRSRQQATFATLC